MLIKDETFRNIYCKPIIIKSKKYAIKQEKYFNEKSKENEINNEVFKKNKVNSLFAFPFVDHNEGMLFLVLATALIKKNNVKIYNRKNFELNSIIKKKSVNNNKFLYLKDVKINKKFNLKHHLKYGHDFTKTYRKNDEIEAFRKIGVIDKLRHENYPDDVLVYFLKNNLKPEAIWVRGEFLEDGYFIGTILNQPKQEFGLNYGDYVTVIIRKTDDGEIICLADFR